jgi:hypothetical protein
MAAGGLVARRRCKGLGSDARHYDHGPNGLQCEEKTSRETGQRATRGSNIEKRKGNGVGWLEAFGPKQLQEKERSFVQSFIKCKFIEIKFKF